MVQINPGIQDKAFTNLLKEAIRNSLARTIETPLNHKIMGIGEARTSISVSIKTRNKLRSLSKANESYEDLILRLVKENENLKKETNDFQMYLKKEKSLVKFSENIYSRVNRTYTCHPNVKIEYSYNDIKEIKLDENRTFDLNIDKILYKGEVVSEKKGIKLILTINILKELSKLDISEDVSASIKKKEQVIDDEYEILRTKYLIYFKILYQIINKSMKIKKIKDDNLFSKDFWKSIFYLQDLPDTSFEVDILRQLSKLESETKQIDMNYQNRYVELQ